MVSSVQSPPGLQKRFTKPEAWRWGVFERNGRKVRYGFAQVDNQNPAANVFILPGLSEFPEKYFETARNLLEQNMSVWVIDWAGQGKSSRYLKNRYKRHSGGFQAYIQDLHYLMQLCLDDQNGHFGTKTENTSNVQKKISKNKIPLAMLAHSMGANIGLRYMLDHPHSFSCAAFSAPMFGILGLKYIPFAVTRLMAALAPESYVPGGKDWHEYTRARSGNDVFSTDPVRGALHNAWCLADPELQVGSVTYRWLYEAEKSCRILRRSPLLETIQTYCIAGFAGDDLFVDNTTGQKVMNRLSYSKTLEFPDAQHELLMERDEIRRPFLKAFCKCLLGS